VDGPGGVWRSVLRALAVAAGLAAVLGCMCASALAATRSTYVMGAGGDPFSLANPSLGVAVTGESSSQTLWMKTGVLATWDGGSCAYIGQGAAHPDPRSVQAIGGGVLVADAANHLVLWMDADGQVVWGYTQTMDDQLRAPTCARKLDDGTFLITDRDAQRVFVVGLNGHLRWQYGTTGVAGSGVDQLDSPTYADVRPDGNILICDAGNHRVIVVRKSDYDSGFSASSILWQYGTTGVAGSGVDQLDKPASVQWLTYRSAEGNALIADPGAGSVVEVRGSDYRDGAGDHGFSAGSIVWEYPAGGGSAQPSCAVGMFGGDGIVWISDSSSGRVYAVATGSGSSAPTGHDVIADYGPGAPGFAGSLSAPTAIALSGDGAVAVADPGAGRVCVVGAALGTAVTRTQPLTCGRAGRKHFISISCAYADVPYTSLGVMYRIDDGGWITVTQTSLNGTPSGTGATTTVSLPVKKLSVGATLTCQLTMGYTRRALVPSVASLAITYEPAGPSSGSGGGGQSGNNKNANGSGTYSYPGSGGGSGQGTGGGTGGGTGSGSGAGTGSGYGSGSSGSTAGALSDAPAMAGGATGQELPSVVDPAAETAPGSVAEVSGYLMRASGFAGGGEGGGSSPQQAVTAGGWMLLPAGIGLLCLALFAVVAARENRRIRAYADFAPGRARGLSAEHTPTTRPLLPPYIVKPAGRC